VEVRRILVSHRYLTYKYHLEPSKEKKGRIMKEHFLWNNWKRAEKGGLVCKDEELVEKQKKMFKLILKKFGETLLSGRNIINFSLPVIVFKKEYTYFDLGAILNLWQKVISIHLSLHRKQPVIPAPWNA
jgi:hypothetical protein